SVGAAGILLRRPQGFTDVRIFLLALAAVLVLSQLDGWMNRGMRGHYNRHAVEGAPFTSAVVQTGFGAVAAGAPPRHLMVIMVESLGEPVGNAEMDRLKFIHFRDPEVAKRFEAASGTTTYYNST